MNQYFDEAGEKQENLIRYRYKDKEDMFDHHSYEKGGKVLHMLRKYVGDEAFFASLNRYLNKHEFNSVEIHDLRLAFEETTGEDLSWFFNQWFLSPGHPVLDVRHGFKNGKIVINIKQKQDTILYPIYKIPIKIELQTGEEKKIFHCEINRYSHSFVLCDSTLIGYVSCDPDQDLLAVINHKKTVFELISQYYNSGKAVARNAALTDIGKILVEAQDSTKTTEFTLEEYEAIHKLFLNGLNDHCWKIREAVCSFWTSYSGTYFNFVEQKLVEMALKDPKSLVRASAIRALSSLGSNDYNYIYKKAMMNDSSYAVNASALEAYIKGKGQNVDEKISKFMNYTNINLILVLADYFTVEADKSKFNWFTSQISRARTNELYILLQYFGRYLLISDMGEQQKGLKILANIASSHPSGFIKGSAQQTLELLMDLPDAKETINENKEK